jgi:mRNA-degrading endonuclease YafQ of YafQ-DinJ toxin-antitoxin module
LARELHTTRTFDRLFKRLPSHIRTEAIEKVVMYLNDPAHPSLRAKRIRGSERLWELSVTMNYRITFEVEDDRVILRRIGTHDILKSP